MQTVGSRAVAGEAALEAALAAKGKKLVPYHFRDFRMLMTPAARQAVLPALLQASPGISTLQAAMQRAVLDMWVDFVWTVDNPHLDPAVGVFPCPVSPAW